MRTTSTRARMLFSGLALAIAAGVVVGGQAPRQQRDVLVGLSIAGVLDWYASGQLAVGGALASNPNPRDFARALETRGGRWIEAGEPAARPRRRLVAATFALEVAHAMPHADRGAVLRRLTVWGANVFRSAPPADPLERLWCLTAVSLIESADEWTFLTGPRSAPPEAASSTGRINVREVFDRGFLSYSKARFPDEHRFALAAAVAAENTSWTAGGFGRDQNTSGGIIPGEITPEYLSALNRGDLLMPDGVPWSGPDRVQAGRAQLPRIEALRALGRRYADLAGEASISAEAHLRLGLVSFRLADRDVALTELALVEQTTTDPYLLYLSRLLTGVVLERQGRDDAAVEAFRAALRAVPGAQSSVTRLVAALARMGRQDDAAAAADAFFAAPPAPVDPWHGYRAGDARLWPVSLERLRKAWQ